MKEVYEKPEVDVVMFDKEDIVMDATGSGTHNGGSWGDEG